MLIHFVVAANLMISAVALVVLPFVALYIPLLAAIRWTGRRFTRIEEAVVLVWLVVLLVSYFDILMADRSNIPIFGPSIRALQRRILDKVPMLKA